MMPKRQKRRSQTPVRAILLDDSSLLPKVEDGLEAVKKMHRDLIDIGIRPSFGDSLDIDEAFRPGRGSENRWDYLLGHRPSRAVVALEPHSANEKEISVVIAKCAAAKEQLAPHLKPGAWIKDWLWVASGRVHIADTEKTRRRLDENGIKFVAPKVLPKHLP